MAKDNVLVPAMIAELLEVIHNALLVIDSDHKIIFANSRTAKMFNTVSENLLGQPFSTLFMPDDVDIFVENILSITRMHREIESEAMFFKRDGDSFLGRISGTCFRWAENKEGMVFSINDISDMKEIEKSLKHSERSAFLGRLIDDISHQIRNPIVAIGGFARRLQATHDIADNVEIILQEASRLEKLLDTINRFAKLQRPKMEKVRMGNLVEKLETVVGARVKKLGCTWACFCDDILYDEILLLDKNLFLEAILGVAENACEAYYQTAAGVEKSVICEVLHNGEETFPFTFKVVDVGAGIAEHVQGHVFSHFYTDKTGHIGMGLTFAKRIIEEQGGTMTIESKPGNGTTVNVNVIKERRRSLRIKRLQ